MDIGIRSKLIYWNQESKQFISRCSEVGQDVRDLNSKLDKKVNKLWKILLEYKEQSDGKDPDVDWVKKKWLEKGNKMQTSKEVKKRFEDW